MKKIIIWGIGDRTNAFQKQGFFDDCHIIGYVETNRTKDEYYGKNVYSVDELCQFQKQADFIVVCNEYYDEILNTCLANGIDMNKGLFGRTCG